MFKRYSKNGGETSTFCLVAVLAREAERLSSLRHNDGISRDRYDSPRMEQILPRQMSAVSVRISAREAVFPPGESESLSPSSALWYHRVSGRYHGALWGRENLS